jgi:hypothetical protein
MQIKIQSGQFRLAGTLLLALSTMMLLFSCKKNVAGINEQEPNTINSSAATQNNSVETSIPYDRTLYVQCANEGEGEEVLLTGFMSVNHNIVYNNKGFTLSYHANPHGIKGVGLTTGDTYVASGGTQDVITGSYTNDQFSAAVTEQFRLIGPKNTFIVKYMFKYTVTPDGQVTTSISEDKAECRF